MRLLSKVIAGTLLVIGVPLSAALIADLMNPKSTDREGAIAALLILGLPPTALGSWMIGSAISTSRQEERDRIRSAFFQLLEAQDGHITVIAFSKYSGLDGTRAKSYLNERAKEFNAIYNVTEEGNISYYFNLDGSDPTE